ncbi:MAG: inositol monophosphatase [Candidatus Nanohaloarchaea archaeon]
MNFEQSQYSQELEVAREAAREAGKILDEYREEGVEVSDTKETETDLVTQADLDAQQEVVRILRNNFPGDAIRAEEEQLSEDHSDRVWVIDPVDGTTNFHHGLDYFCTSIGLRVGSSYVLGVVHSPVSGLGETYIGLARQGSYRLEEPKSRSGEHLSVEKRGLRGSIYTTYLREGVPEKFRVQLELMEEFSSRNLVNRSRGAAALDTCRIAAGETHIFADFISEWDYAGARAVLEHAGGELSTIETGLDQDFVVASNGVRHDELVELSREVLERF